VWCESRNWQPEKPDLVFSLFTEEEVFEYVLQWMFAIDLEDNVNFEGPGHLKNN